MQPCNAGRPREGWSISLKHQLVTQLTQSARCIGVARIADGSPVVSKACNAADGAQRWNWTAAPETIAGVTGYRVKLGGRCLTVAPSIGATRILPCLVGTSALPQLWNIVRPLSPDFVDVRAHVTCSNGANFVLRSDQTPPPSKTIEVWRHTDWTAEYTTETVQLQARMTRAGNFLFVQYVPPYSSTFCFNGDCTTSPHPANTRVLATVPASRLSPTQAAFPLGGYAPSWFNAPRYLNACSVKGI
jgi:hypothetical protein